MNPQLTIDYRKVSFASFYYKTRVFGYVRRTLPRKPTLHGQPIHDELILKLATQQGKLDDWIPQLRLSVTANRTLKFVGTEAVKRWKEYNSTIHRKKS